MLERGSESAFRAERPFVRLLTSPVSILTPRLSQVPGQVLGGRKPIREEEEEPGRA